MRSRALLVLLLPLALAVAFLDVPHVSPAPPVEASETRQAAHNDTSTPFNLVSLPALMHHRYDGRGLTTRRTGRDPGVRHFAIAYRGAGLRITGRMTAPAHRGQFPVVVLAHGYHLPAAYHPQRVNLRERLYLARHGFVVVQPDYRNYGDSTREGLEFVEAPRGYPEDLLNVVRALRLADLRFVRPGPVHLFGRSMGGGAALQAMAAQPRWFGSAVLSSPLSSVAAANFHRWVPRSSQLYRRVADGYGLPRDNPGFWRAASVRTYLDRISAPVWINHGTADDVCPLRWSRQTKRALRRSSVPARLYTYRGQGHLFHGKAWRTMMRRTVRAYVA